MAACAWGWGGCGPERSWAVNPLVGPAGELRFFQMGRRALVGHREGVPEHLLGDPALPRGSGGGRLQVHGGTYCWEACPLGEQFVGVNAKQVVTHRCVDPGEGDPEALV